MSDQALMAAIGEHAIVLHLATQKRAAARTKLSKLRKAWLAENDAFYDQGGEDYSPEIEAATVERSTANKELRAAKSRLSYVINKHIRAAAAIAQQRGSRTDPAPPGMVRLIDGSLITEREYNNRD